jgi:hypothetical protein
LQLYFIHYDHSQTFFSLVPLRIYFIVIIIGASLWRQYSALYTAHNARRVM